MLKIQTPDRKNTQQKQNKTCLKVGKRAAKKVRVKYQNNSDLKQRYRTYPDYCSGSKNVFA